MDLSACAGSAHEGLVATRFVAPARFVIQARFVTSEKSCRHRYKICQPRESDKSCRHCTYNASSLGAPCKSELRTYSKINLSIVNGLIVNIDLGLIFFLNTVLTWFSLTVYRLVTSG